MSHSQPVDDRRSLDQLRRDAKRLLKRIRAQDPDAGGRLASNPQSVRLADAQFAIAREQGYPSWPKLVRDLERLTPIDQDTIDWNKITSLTICCYLSPDQLIMIETPDGYRIPAGDVEAGEDVLLDSVLRIPLRTAGFRRQGTHLVAVSTDRHHALIWVDGNRYYGQRDHPPDVGWWTGAPDQAARLLREQGDGMLAHAVELAEHHRSTITDTQLAEDSRRILDPSYLNAPTAQGGSGFGGTAAEWRAAREQICDAIGGDGSFLDVGCANGLLMESVVAWSAERGIAVEPYGIDHSAPLVELACTRLPRWADRIWTGDALSWTHPQGQRFEVVHVLIDVIPDRRQAEMIGHHLEHVVSPGGRLILSNYGGRQDQSGESVLRRHGYPVDGVTAMPARGRADDLPSAWVVNR